MSKYQINECEFEKQICWIAGCPRCGAMIRTTYRPVVDNVVFCDECYNYTDVTGDDDKWKQRERRQNLG